MPVSFAQLPVAVTRQRIEDGGKSAEKVCTLLNEKANWSAQYARSLAGSARFVLSQCFTTPQKCNLLIFSSTNYVDLEIPNSSTQKMFKSLRNYINNDAQQHHQVSEKLRNHVQVV
jgi:hypothetical protein